jgi:hypothetical protein
MYDGLFTRVVRLVLLAFGLVVAGDVLKGVLWVLAVMTLFTTLQRLFVAWQRLRAEDRNRRVRSLVRNLGFGPRRLVRSATSGAHLSGHHRHVHLGRHP